MLIYDKTVIISFIEITHIRAQAVLSTDIFVPSGRDISNDLPHKIELKQEANIQNDVLQSSHFSITLATKHGKQEKFSFNT